MTTLIVRPSLLVFRVSAYLAGVLIARLTGGVRMPKQIAGTARPEWTLRAWSHRPVAGVAAELGIVPTMLRRWQRKQQEGSASPASPAAKPPVSAIPSPADQASEIARLRRELDWARMERDILKKAVGIFAEMPR